MWYVVYNITAVQVEQYIIKNDALTWIRTLSEVSTLELHELFYIFSLTITIFTSPGVFLFNRVATDNKHTVCPPPLAKGPNNHHSAIHWPDKNSKLQCDKVCFYINSMPPFCIRLAENHTVIFLLILTTVVTQISIFSNLMHLLDILPPIHNFWDKTGHFL